MLFLLRKRSRGSSCGRNISKVLSETITGAVMRYAAEKFLADVMQRSVWSEAWAIDRTSFLTCFFTGDEKSIILLEALVESQERFKQK